MAFDFQAVTLVAFKAKELANQALAEIAALPSPPGTVTHVTSVDNSLTVTNPLGPIVDLAVLKAPIWSTARLLAGNSVNGGANVPFANKFIAQGTTDSGLSGAQFLGSLATGIVKNTTTTGVLSIAGPSDFPTFNQNTTGSAGTLSPGRNINGVLFDGLTNITVTVPISTGVTGLGSGIAMWAATPSSANLLAAMSDHNGTGLLVFDNSPTLTTASLGSSTATTQAPGDNSTKLATTAFVNTAVVSLVPKAAVDYATIAALPAVTYANGASGVGATLTENSNGALSVDGGSPSVGQRVLVKNQASTFQNGWFSVTATGSAGAVFVLTRATDSDQAAEISAGVATFVINGSLTGTTWAVNSASSPVMGTDPITFVQTSGPGTITSGNGITVTGTSVAINTAVTVDKTTAQTLLNKTLTSPILTAPDLGTPSSGILTNCTFPTLNQNTTGSAAKWTTARLLAGNSVDGSVNVAFANAFIVQGTADSGLSGAQFLGALATGIVKVTTTTGALSVASAGDFPTLNQSTSGNAATATALQTARNIGGVSFNGTASITVSTATAGFTVSGGDLAIGANNLTITGSIGSTGSRVLKGWLIDLQVTNAIAGSVTGSAGTATTATNLAGGAGGSIPYQSAAGTTAMLANGSSGQVLQSSGGTSAPTWVTLSASGVLSVASADGSVTVTGSSAIDLAVVKAPKWSTARNLAGNSVDGSANVAFANKFVVQGTSDAGLSAAQFLGVLSTGILKVTTTTGVLSTAIAADFPTLNQPTTGNAATATALQTARAIYGNNFDGTAALTQVIAPTFGGTGTAALTAGSIPFITSGGVFTQDNARFFWDGTNFRVGIGTNTPARRLELFDSGSDYQLRIGKGTTTSYDIGRKDSTGLLNFFGNQTGFVGYVFTGIDGEQGRFTSAGLTASLTNCTALPFPAGVTLANQTANVGFFGPTSGGAAAPTFRLLTTTDIPSLTGLYVGLSNTTWTAIGQDIYLDAQANLAAGVAAAAGKRLIVTTQYSVTSSASTAGCTVVFQGSGSFTTATGQTLTIPQMESPGPRQVFFGLGNAVLGKNAVPRFNIAWWAGIAGSGSNDNHAFDQAVTSLTNNGGGILDLGLGVWKVFNFIPPSGTTLHGAGSGTNASNATVLTLSDLSTAGSVILANYADFWGIKIENMTISAGASTASSCLTIAGANNHTSTELQCSDIHFHGTGANAPAQVKITVTAGSWEINALTLHHCAWDMNTGGIGISCDTDNTSIVVTNPYAYLADGGTFLKASHIGNIKITGATINGGGGSPAAIVTGTYGSTFQAGLSGTTLTRSTGAFTVSDNGIRVVVGGVDTHITQVTSSTTATVSNSGSVSPSAGNTQLYRPVPSTSRGKAVIWLTGSHGMVEYDNGRDESMQYFLITDGGAGGQPYYPVKITNSAIQSFIQMNTDITLYLTGNDLFSNVLQDASGVASKIIASGNRVNTGSLAPGNDPRSGSAWNLVTPQIWGYHDGSSVFVTGLDSVQNTNLQTMGMPLYINHSSEFISDFERTKAVLTLCSSSQTSGGVTKPSIRFGYSDPDTKLPLYYYDVGRNSNDGFCYFTGNQTGFVGYVFDGGLRLPSMADSSAANDSWYFSTTLSKAAYKDSGGTSHALY